MGSQEDRDFDGAIKLLETTAGQFVDLTHAELETLGLFGIRLVVLRTRSGRDLHLEPFKPYSPAYAEVRRRKPRQVSPPDLAMIGTMLGSMEPEVVGKEVHVVFNDPLQALKALTHNAPITSPVPQREFLGIEHPAELEACSEVILDALGSRLK